MNLLFHKKRFFSILNKLIINKPINYIYNDYQATTPIDPR